jgi:hypothetical protein
MATDYINIEADLNSAIEQVVAELPRGAARLEKKRGKDGGIALNIIPSNPHAAPMGAHAENGSELVDFWFGEFGTTWELPIEGQNPGATKTEVLAEVQQLCRAVLDGRCEERIGLFWTAGIIYVAGETYGIRNFFYLYWRRFFSGQRRVRYQPCSLYNS